MISKLFYSLLLCSVIVTEYTAQYDGSTLAAVNIAGAVVKATHVETVKKYKRSDCPVCKGKGWYISGDKITEVPCGYCEPESKDLKVNHPPAILKPDCKTRVHQQ